MVSKKSSKKQQRRETDVVPDGAPRLPLDGTPWNGYDNALWVDLAVDSSGPHVALWLRQRVKSGQYFLIASCLYGHVMKTEVTKEEAKRLYLALPDRAPSGPGIEARREADEKDK